MILKKRKFHIIFTATFYIIGVLLIISIIAFHFKPATFSFFAITALFFPLLWIIEALLLLLLIFKHNFKLVVISIIILLSGLYQVSLLLNFSDNNSSGLSHNKIKLISFNAGNADTINPYESRKQCFDNKSFLDADIVCLQEFKPTDDSNIVLLESFNNKISVDYYGMLNRDSSGLSIYTDYKILDFGFLKQKAEDTYAFWCLIKAQEDTINLINVQLQSIRLEDDELESMTSMDNIIRLPFKIFTIYPKLKRGFEWREEQVEKLIELVSNSKYPVILCGDFNDPPSSYTYNKLSGLLTDAYLEKGNGFGFTYAGRLPFLRIDYVMVSGKVDILSYQKINITHSDHYPLSVSFSVDAKTRRGR